MAKLISRPAVIQTQVTPPQTAFYIEKTGQTQQVYNDHLGEYVPDRKDTPLLLTPVVNTYDPETQTTSPAVINSVVWTDVSTGNELPGSDANYERQGISLLVKKNVSPSKAIAINCRAVYLDPNDAAISYTVEESVTLETLKDATVVHPRLNVLNEPETLFDPFIDATEDAQGNITYDSLTTFRAQAILRGVDLVDIVDFLWYARQGKNGTDYLIDAMGPDGFPRFLAYSMATQPTGKGQGTDTITLDARYGTDLYITLRARYKYTYVTTPGTVNPQTMGWYERTQTTIASPSGNPSTQGWYQKVEDIYIPTSDTSVVTGKTYYTITYTLTSDVTVVEDKRYYTRSGNAFPDQVTRLLTWTLPPMEIQAYSKNGSQAGPELIDKVFTTIVNITRRTVSDNLKKAHMLFAWKSRKVNASSVTSRGWGQEMPIATNALRDTANKVNTNVYCEAYVCGPYEKVTDPDGTVTDNGELVIDRDYE